MFKKPQPFKIVSQFNTSEAEPYIRPCAAQTAEVLRIMMRDGYISRRNAQDYGIANVTARIADLRNRVQVDVLATPSEDAKGTKFTKWHVNPAQLVEIFAAI